MKARPKLDSYNIVAAVAAAFLAATAQAASSTEIKTSESSAYKISKNGTYTMSGTYSEKKFYVDVEKDCTIEMSKVTAKKAEKGSFIHIGGKYTVTLKLTKGASVIEMAAEYPGIHVPEGATLIIESDKDDYSLSVTGGAGAAAIGGNSGEACGTITINGGTITATAGAVSSKDTDCGAGIGGGGGAKGTGGTVTINGGVVTATGASNSKTGGKGGAGIGGGGSAAGGTVTITGGTVKATGGYNEKDDTYGAAGIGGGGGGAGGTVVISSGTVTALGAKGGSGIGGGFAADGDKTTIDGGVVYATGGMNASGIGGGVRNATGTVVVNDGSVWASCVYEARDGYDGATIGDVGRGLSTADDASGSFTVNGGNVVLMNGKATGIAYPKNASGARVWPVYFHGFASGTQIKFAAGLPDYYGKKAILSGVGDMFCVWLPDGTHDMTVNDVRYRAIVDGAGTTAAILRTFTFADGQGGTCATLAFGEGQPMTPPGDPSRTGHTFTGWTPEVPTAAPAADATYTATWMPTPGTGGMKLKAVTKMVDGVAVETEEAAAFNATALDITQGEAASSRLLVAAAFAIELEDGVDFAEWVAASNGSGKFKMATATAVSDIDNPGKRTLIDATATVLDATAHTVTISFSADMNESCLFFRAIVTE